MYKTAVTAEAAASLPTAALAREVLASDLVSACAKELASRVLAELRARAIHDHVSKL